MFSQGSFDRTVRQFQTYPMGCWEDFSAVIHDMPYGEFMPKDMIVKGIALALMENKPWETKYKSILTAYAYGKAYYAAKKYVRDVQTIQYALEEDAPIFEASASADLKISFDDLRTNNLPVPRPDVVAQAIYDYIEKPMLTQNCQFTKPFPTEVYDNIQIAAGGVQLLPSRPSTSAIGRFIKALSPRGHDH